MARYLNLSELAYVRHRAAEIMRSRRPRRAARVRAFAPEPPAIPAPRRPMDLAPVAVLFRVLDGLHRMEVA
ncbi:hypothetical protein NE857_31685 [Nocardiopsis exhalans]|uniref:Uncharacterized protein n=1 Tax=Nocardiopsis exhalans TaxID=163604 RepID=A0ABY5D5T3_9ACTN|nr:hypothetical protein [Nocardiopsis exhalans]USY19741.1 hypothetical protein NE857_31685 [Nocardiopsis exhalans]